MAASRPDLDALEAFAVELAAVAGAAILPLFRADNGLVDKAGPAGVFDPVTAADRNAEAAIRREIARRHPDHGVIGEEYGRDRPDAEHVWVVDPIDGTRAFISGLPVWTTLIALRREGRPVLGVIAQPVLGEVFVGGPGGARLLRAGEEAPLRARACPGLSSATAATTDPFLFRGADQEAFSRLRGRVRLVRYGCDAYAYAMVGLGLIDVVVEAGLKAWDVEAAIPIIEACGGMVSDWRGDPIGSEGGSLLICGDPGRHAEVVELLSPA